MARPEGSIRSPGRDSPALASGRGRSAWVALAAVVVLGVGVGVAFRQWRAPEGPKPAATAREEPSDSTIEQALRQIPAPVDSAILKSRWVDEVRGVDASALSQERRELLLRFANAERCTCGCGYTLAACRSYDLTCPVSLPRVQSLLDSVRSGRIRSAAGLRERPREAAAPRR